MASGSTLYLSLFVYLALFTLSSQSDEKVTLDVYYESLCPGSSQFIVDYLPVLFDSDLISIVDLKLSPYGNTKLYPWIPGEPITNATFYCQHGEYECLLDIVQACAIDIWPEVIKHFSFIHCIEKLVSQGKETEWESCFDKLDLDPEPIKQCYTSDYGEKLELKYAAETAALQPRKLYVPWVVLNGEPLYEDIDNYISRICSAYKGSDAFEICGRASNLRQVKGKPKPSVCYMERGMSTWEK
ncbi:hypothetical protein RJT34_12512 [Clitoria ternatea]|uniref:Gamma-interferon-inducible lysosomal thiol reductase n=1 Tax=Clitoria ternatea TaxID=43366 RepID=A0AAN9JPR8_CLITE